MSKLTNDLYSAGRSASKAGSVIRDVENIVDGHPEKVVKKMMNREAHKVLQKGLNSILKGIFS